MSAMGKAGQSDRSVSDLLGSMAQDVSILVRKEVELGREELRQEARRASKVGMDAGAAVVCGLLAGIALVLTAGFALAEVMPTGLAFLIVTVVLAVVTALLGLRARNRAAQLSPVPEQTVETLKEDAQWLSEQMR